MLFDIPEMNGDRSTEITQESRLCIPLSLASCGNLQAHAHNIALNNGSPPTRTIAVLTLVPAQNDLSK